MRHALWTRIAAKKPVVLEIIMVPGMFWGYDKQREATTTTIIKLL